MKSNNERVFKMAFSSVYPHYLEKAEKKGRTKAEVQEIILWLTGYSEEAFEMLLQEKTNFETFFNSAPQLNPNSEKVTGVICGYRIEEMDDPLMKKIRILDKLIDELAKGRPMQKILRS